jgi:hypothetical protein
VTRGSVQEAGAGSARRQPAQLAAFPAAGVSGSSLVADVAIHLAATGRSVLVLDWSADATAVEAQLHRIPGRELVTAELSEVVREALQRMFGPAQRTTADDARTRPFGRWWRHEMASLPGRLTVAGFTDGTPGRGVVPQRRSDELVHGLCTALRATSEFDHILLLGAAPRGPAWLDLVVGVADVAVLPMAADPGQTLREAVDLLGRRPDDLTLIGLPPGGDPRVGLELAATAFAPPDFPPDSIHLVPMSAPAGAGVVPLSALQPPASHGMDGPRRISAIIAGRDDVDAPARHLRDGYLRAVGLPLAGPPPVFRLAYTALERPWADEIAGWLRAANVRVRRFRSDGGPAPGERVLALLSGHLLADQDLLAALPVELDAVEPEVLDGAASPAVPASWRRIDLRLVAPEDRRSVVMGQLDLFVDGALNTAPQARTARLLGPVPGRNPLFVGREELMETLRDAFAPLDQPPPDRPCAVLVGAAGVGKTGLAAEYAHRFAEAYTGVLWLPAQDESTRRAALAAVAREEAWTLAGAGLPHALLQSRPERDQRRWLVVFDGVEQDLPATADLAEVADVLITTTSGARPDDAAIVVDELGPVASAAILRNERIGVPGLTDAQVADVVRAVGNLPIPLSLAAGALRHRVRTRRDDQVATVAAQQEAATSLVDAVGPSTDAAVERIVRIVVDALDREPIGRLAVRLAELCAFLSPAGVALSLVRSRGMVRHLAGTDDAGVRLLADEIELDRVLALGSRFGLFSVDWAAPPVVRMHRVLQKAVITLLPPPEQAARRAAVLAVLAELSPLETEGPLANRIHRELRRHVASSRAVDATTDEQLTAYLGDPAEPGTAAWSLRRWIVEQVGYTYRSGELSDHLSALEVVARLEPLWHDRYGAGDPLRCRLADLHGGLLFKVGRAEDARKVDEGVLADLRRSLGAHHPRTVHSAGGLSGDLRRLGRFEESQPEAETVWAELRATFGEDHPRTLAAAHNLAWARFLAGAQEEALNLHRRSHRRRRRVLGRQHLWYRESQRSLGFFLRECGLLTEGRAQLEDAKLLRARDLDPDDDPEHLRVEHALAVTVRRAGDRVRPSRAVESLVGQLERVLGEDHPDTLAAVLNWTAELAALNRTDEAVRVADGCVPRMRTAVEDDAHPFVGAAMIDAALAHLAAGDAAGAVRLGDDAVALLADAVADTHPWLLTAQLDHARALAEAEQAGPATELLQATESLSREYLPNGHPTAILAASNIDLLVQFGAGSAAAAQWGVLDIDIPPT